VDETENLGPVDLEPIHDLALCVEDNSPLLADAEQYHERHLPELALHTGSISLAEVEVETHRLMDAIM